MAEQTMTPNRPLDRPVYGHIPHLPGSRLGPGDWTADEGHVRIATASPRDRTDTVIVTEKLDGANVGVAKIDAEVVALSRKGYTAASSSHPQLLLFDEWVHLNYKRLRNMLKSGEVLVGEWLAMAHGTRYDLEAGETEPFVPFDLFLKNGKRALWEEVQFRCFRRELRTAQLIHYGLPLKIEEAERRLGDHGYHGAIDKAEGVMYRIEHHGAYEFHLKYVRPGKVDGKYIPEISGEEPIWHWRPEWEPEQATT